LDSTPSVSIALQRLIPLVQTRLNSLNSPRPEEVSDQSSGSISPTSASGRLTNEVIKTNSSLHRTVSQRLRRISRVGKAGEENIAADDNSGASTSRNTESPRGTEEGKDTGIPSIVSYEPTSPREEPPVTPFQPPVTGAFCMEHFLLGMNAMTMASPQPDPSPLLQPTTPDPTPPSPSSSRRRKSGDEPHRSSSRKIAVSTAVKPSSSISENINRSPRKHKPSITGSLVFLSPSPPVLVGCELGQI